MRGKVTEYCTLKHLKHVWIILMAKRCVLQTLDGQDPFYQLHQQFKSEAPSSGVLLNEEGLLNAGASGSGRHTACSILLVLYQIVTFVLSSLSSNEDMQIYENIP